MRKLATRLARGDESAFAELYDACADRLHHYVAVRLGSRDAASDVVQTVFLRAVKSRRRFSRVENPVAYLFQIARNEVVRAAERDRPEKTKTLMGDELFTTPDHAAQQAEDGEAAAMALARLSADVREVVELKIYAGLTLREIADVTGSPAGTVATRYRRALESLRGWLTKQLR